MVLFICRKCVLWSLVDIHVRFSIQSYLHASVCLRKFETIIPSYWLRLKVEKFAIYRTSNDKPYWCVISYLVTYSLLIEVCEAAARHNDTYLIEYLVYKQGELPEQAIVVLLSHVIKWVTQSTSVGQCYMYNVSMSLQSINMLSYIRLHPHSYILQIDLSYQIMFLSKWHREKLEWLLN